MVVAPLVPNLHFAAHGSAHGTNMDEDPQRHACLGEIDHASPLGRHDPTCYGHMALGGFSYPLGTQNLSVTESREDEHQILSTLPYDRATSEVSIPSVDHAVVEMQTLLILS